MEIYQIQNLSCRKKENRILLAKEVRTLLGKEKYLSLEQIEKAAKYISKKYKMKIQLIKKVEGFNSYTISVDTGISYSLFKARTLYEVYAKFILLVYQYVKLSKMEVK